MLSSSKEYLEALRAGKYLRFLEWPHFVTQHYYQDKTLPDADDLLNLIVFEWLNNGFCEEDAKKIALLNAVYELESRPLRGNLNYSLTTISIAVFQCMVYESNGLKHRFISEEVKSRTEILKFMKRSMACIDEPTFKDHLEKEQNRFLGWSTTASPQTVETARIQISAITATRYILEEYIFTLEACKVMDDPLRISRWSMAKSLTVFLNDQTELTPLVTEKIGLYVNRIRELKPTQYEEDYLNSISPLSVLDNTWRFVSTFSVGFFNLLQKPNQNLAAATSSEYDYEK